ncbi:MAG: glycosyltransferase family 4 protein [Candidatus Moranbacteria bacterium]|nr:glycosyltransferase family 4 protein [Candidatus Moranbacteria bacterium]
MGKRKRFCQERILYVIIKVTRAVPTIELAFMLKIGVNALFLRKVETGIGRVTKSLLAEIARLDRSNQYYLYTDSRVPFSFPANFRIKILSSTFYRREDLIKQTFWERITIAREAEKDKLNVFFSPYNAATRFKTIPHLVLLHDVIWKALAPTYLYNFRRRIYAQQTFEAARAAKRILTVSEFSRQDIIKHLDIEPERIKVIGAGVSSVFRPLEKNDRRLLRTLAKFNINHPFIFYIGGFEIRKNVGLLIKSFAKLLKNYGSNLKNRILVIGGDPPTVVNPLLEDVKGMAASLGIADRVKFVGKVTDEEMMCLYNGADFFVFPSLYEGFGLNVLEGMACGTPIIASEINPIKEVAQDTVYYFHPEREDELIQAINRFLTDQVIKEELRVKAINRARVFNWNKPAKILLEELKISAKGQENS